MRYRKSFMLAKAGAVAALATLMIAGVTTWANAGDTSLHRLAADYQNTTSLAAQHLDEVSTVAPPGPAGTGGVPVYQKTLSVPYDVVFITFSAQGDSHNGSALAMSANVTDEDNNKQLCQPLAGQTGPGGGGSVVTTGWYTLTKLPVTGLTNLTTPPANCNDGGGGSADCHDNTIYFSCCARVKADTDEYFSADDPFEQTVQIRLADQPGGGTNRAFYERATIYIDAESDPNHTLCTGVGVPVPSNP